MSIEKQINKLNNMKIEIIGTIWVDQVQNRFLSYLEFMSKTDMSNHVMCLTSHLSLLTAPNLLAEIPFIVPTRGIQNLEQFYVPHHSTAYMVTIRPLHRVTNLNVP